MKISGFKARVIGQNVRDKDVISRKIGACKYVRSVFFYVFGAYDDGIDKSHWSINAINPEEEKHIFLFFLHFVNFLFLSFCILGRQQCSKSSVSHFCQFSG